MRIAVSIGGLDEGSKDTATKLVALGYRRFKNYLLDEKSEDFGPAFGLTNPIVLFPLHKDQEQRIECLPKIASNLELQPNTLIIRYKHVNYWTATYEYASALPFPRQSTKRAYSGRRYQAKAHKRWIAMEWKSERVHGSEEDCYCFCLDECESNCICDIKFDGCSQECHCNAKPDMCAIVESLSRRKRNVEDRAIAIKGMGEECVEVNPRMWLECHQALSQKLPPSKTQYDISRVRELYYSTWQSSTLSWRDEIYLRDPPWALNQEGRAERIGLRFLFGDKDTAALYQIEGPFNPEVCRTSLTNELSIDDIKDLFKKDAIDILGISTYFVSLNELFSDYLVSLKGLASAAEVYKLFPDATVALNVASRPLHRSYWTDYEDTQENPWLLEMSLPSTFAYIRLYSAV